MNPTGPTMNPLAWRFVAMRFSGSLRLVNVVHTSLLHLGRHGDATVNASTRMTVVVALAKKPRIPSGAIANKATACVGDLWPL
jgi:hypothetical protein